jgi:YVTN family beta-propeller protein
LLVTHFYSGRLSLIDPVTLAPQRVIETGADTNWSQHVAIAPDGQRAYLPQTRFFADNPVRQFDSSVFPVVNVIDLATLTVLNAARITLDTADQPIGLPVAVEFLSDGQLLVTANAASDDLSIIDLRTGHKTAHVEVGSNPQGMVAAPDGRSLLVNQVLDGSLGVLDPQSWQLSPAPLTLTALPLLPQLLRGKKLFWSSSRPDLARDQWMSCATCHFDGFHDARTWRSFPDGPRNTTALFNLADTTPLHWSGDLDEVADVEATVRFIQAGKGLAPAPRIDTLGDPLTGVSPALDDLVAFLRTLRPPASPHDQDRAGIARGRAVFDQLACATCHAGTNFTDRKNHDVGTGDALVERNSHGRGVSFDTPSLFGLWLTGPYLHDGSAARLEDVFGRGPAHDLTARASAQQSADLVVFLRSL